MAAIEMGRNITEGWIYWDRSLFVEQLGLGQG